MATKKVEDLLALNSRAVLKFLTGGLLIAETAPVEVDERAHVQVVDVTDGRAASGAPFPWARIGTRALLRRAGAAGWLGAGQWTAGERRFVALRSSGRPASSSAEPPNSTAVISSQRARKPSADNAATDR